MSIVDMFGSQRYRYLPTEIYPVFVRHTVGKVRVNIDHGTTELEAET
jgi:hypothetical protein